MIRNIEDQNRLVLFYKRNFMNIDMIIAIISVVVLYYMSITLLNSTSIEQWILTIKTSLYPVIATISGALLGFVITGVSIILLAFTPSNKLTSLKKSSQYKNIFNVYFRAIYYLAITTIISVFGLIITTYNTFWFWILITSSTISLLGLYRCIWILEKIVKITH